LGEFGAVDAMARKLTREKKGVNAGGG
jgi:hypothetical protein